MLEKHAAALDPPCGAQAYRRAAAVPRSALYIFAWLLLYFPSAPSGRIKGLGLIFRTAEVEEAERRGR